MIRLLRLFAATGLVAALPAQAADFAGPALYLGVAHSRVDIDARSSGVGRARASRARAVVAAGYDFRVTPHLTLGVALGGTIGDQHACPALDGRRYCLDIRTEFTALGRAGYRIGPKLQLFGEAGYASSRVRMTYTDAAYPGLAVVRTAGLMGLQLGTGVELALSPHSFARVEYRFTDYWVGMTENQVIAGVGVRF